VNWTEREKTVLCFAGALGMAIVLILAIYSRW
jgi:hypothetical protein